MSARISEELLNELTEKLLDAYRARLEAQRAYYGREAEEDPVREQAVVEAFEAYQRAEFLYHQALTFCSPYTDPESEYARFAATVAAKEGWTK